MKFTNVYIDSEILVARLREVLATYGSQIEKESVDCIVGTCIYEQTGQIHSRWHNYPDELPEPGSRCWVVVTGGSETFVTTAILFGVNKRDWRTAQDASLVGPVTHWMKMDHPDLPEAT